MEEELKGGREGVGDVLRGGEGFVVSLGGAEGDGGVVSRGAADGEAVGAVEVGEEGSKSSW